MKLKDKKVIQGLILFCVAIVVTLSLFGDKGLLQYYTLKQQEKSLIEEIEQLKQEKQEWIRKIHSLKNNRSYMETVAREELGMVKNNEILIRFHHK